MLEGDNDNHSKYSCPCENSLDWKQVCCEENDPANIKYSTDSWPIEKQEKVQCT
jgi:hypothetical protein